MHQTQVRAPDAGQLSPELRARRARQGGTMDGHPALLPRVRRLAARARCDVSDSRVSVVGDAPPPSRGRRRRCLPCSACQTRLTAGTASRGYHAPGRGKPATRAVRLVRPAHPGAQVLLSLRRTLTERVGDMLRGDDLRRSRDVVVLDRVLVGVLRVRAYAIGLGTRCSGQAPCRVDLPCAIGPARGQPRA